jgi:predicted DNA-binding transcriptional regulator YafY
VRLGRCTMPTAPRRDAEMGLPRPALRRLLALARAQLSRRRILLGCAEPGPPGPERVAEVLALAFEPPRWLVAAWLPGRSSLRVIDLARVRRVLALRQRAGPAPDGFDPLDFALHRLLDPAAGAVEVVTVRLDSRSGPVARALLPTGSVARRGRDWLCRIRTSRPEVVAALSSSLGDGGALDSSASMPRTPPAAKARSTEARLLGLAAWILEQGDPVTRQQIFEAFPADYGGRADAAERKFSRDKDALERLGFTITLAQLAGDEQGPGYAIDPRSCRLPAIELAPEEAALLWTAGTSALRLSLHPLREELGSALRKLTLGVTGLPPRAAPTEELAADLPGAVDGFLEKLIDAWERRRRVAIRYWRVTTGEEVERQVDVYGWASRRGEWLFAGHCHLRNALRVFYVSRVRSVKPAPGAKDDGYRIPDGFEIRRWSRQEPWDYEVHEPREATVRFRGALARIVPQLLPGAAISTDQAGARLATLAVRNLRGLVRQCLAWGPDAELLSPAEGRAMAREILADLAAWRPA